MLQGTLMDEDFPARIEAAFPDRDSAAVAARSLCQRFQLDDKQLNIGSPQELQPRSKRNRFIVRASRNQLHRRQLLATLVAFALIGFSLAPWWQLVTAMILASIGGSWVGTRLRHRVPQLDFQRWFRILVTLLAARMIALPFLGGN